MTDRSMVSIEAIQGRILVIRDQKVLLDSDLAEMYGVETKRLVEAVKRNIERFPEDFMFQISVDEFAILRSQNATSSAWGGRRTPPYVFTEHGVAILSGVLRSSRVVAVNIAIMRAFGQLRQLISSNADLARRIDDLEAVVRGHGNQFQVVFETFRQILESPVKQKNPIGFVLSDDNSVEVMDDE